MAVRLLLLQALMMASVRPTDYSKANVSQRCEQRTVECGEFIPPTNQAGYYDCKFNSKTCGFNCVMKCPTQADGKVMTISSKRHARENYLCSSGQWKRRNTPQAYCIANMPVMEVSQNLHHEEELNNLVNVLFNTSYYYLGMASFYERADVALPGFSQFMTNLWQKEMKYARGLMSYVNMRGGCISLYDIPRPSSHEMLLLKISARPGLAGMEAALGVSKDINDYVLALLKRSKEKKNYSDPHLKHYLEDEIETEKVDTIKKIGDIVTQLRAFSDEDYSIGEYSVDMEIKN